MMSPKDKKDLVEKLNTYHNGATRLLPTVTKRLFNAYYRGVVAQIMFDEPEEDVDLYKRMDE